MPAVARFARQVVRYTAGCLVSLAFWTLWLVLGLLAVLQVYVAFRNELSVPDFVLRQLEGQLTKMGGRVAFERATFDPTGRVLIEHLRAFLPDFSDPVISARAAYVSLNPWSVLLGRFEPREIRLIEGEVLVPAILSPSGKAEPIVGDLDGFILPSDGQVVFRHLSARVGALIISMHGAVILPTMQARPPGELGKLIRTRFREFCRSAVDFTGRLNAFEEPSVDLELLPSPTRGAIVVAHLAGRGLKLDSPVAMSLGAFRATTRFPLWGDAPTMSRLEFTADELHLLDNIEVRQIKAAIRGRLRPTELRVDPVLLEIEADSIVTSDLTAANFSGSFVPDPLPGLHGSAVAEVFGEPLQVKGRVDLKAHTASLQFAGTVSPRALEVVNAHSRVNVRKFFDFGTLQIDRSTADFGPDWKFQQASAQVTLRDITAHGVVMDEGHAAVEVDRKHFYAPDAYARIGVNFARGTYEQDFATRRFRFLLDGQLRPLDISGWFREWWPNFFSRFDFPKSPPVASVDVRGIWGNGPLTTVFVSANADAPSFLKQPLQRIRTRLFIRPGFYDALETHVEAGDGSANGTFAITTHLGTAKWRTIDVDAQSTLAVSVAEGLAGPLGRPVLEPFKLALPPTVKFRGHFDGPAAPEPRHRSFDLEARSTGGFRFHDFPLQDVVFTAALRDDELTVDNILAKFAGGSLRGHAKVWGNPPARRLGFDAAITDASLGLAVDAVQDFIAERKGQSRPVPGKFVQEKANVHLDLTGSAEGRYGDNLSYHGDGNAALRGPEISEVPLLGLLSQLLKFTALRFTTAHASFKINGPKLEFPEVALRGANSAIDAKGEYALDRRQLDFRAKVFPFQESGNVIKTVVGAVLSPISNVLEVKLTGTLEKPNWAFVIGPTNFLRSLAPNEPGPPAPPANPAPAITPPVVPEADGVVPDDAKVPRAAPAPTSAAPAKAGGETPGKRSSTPLGPEK